ncbi:hypothetical protein DL546_004306 [Coniochaeta pulveracea]|uniref:BHLH domain-containing protein n=1 Tax=Coniochaeta pulveracea TaxID=177199 RepID=A0A420YME1_9PEZI|nr:hypothetical protein DL546_004306 [Coniochaeta pulveracea]
MADNNDSEAALFAGLDPFDDGFVTPAYLDGPGAGSPQSNPSASPANASVSNGIAYINGTSASPSLAIPAAANTTQAFFDPSAAPNWDFAPNPPFDTFSAANPFDPTAVLQQQPQWSFQPQQGGPQPLQTDLDNKQFNSAGVTPSSLPSSLQNGNGSSTSNLSPSSFPDSLVRPNPPKDFLNSLTLAQQEKLKSIAMPAHLQYHSPKSESSPPSSAGGTDKRHGSSPTASDAKSGSRKRKSSADVDVDDDDDDEDGDGQQPVKKTAHNMIEKRYRTNLNDKIAALRDSVPALRIMSKSARGEDTTEDREELQGLTPAHKLNKATVLSKATEYIRHLEKRNNRLSEEVNSMQARISAFEKLFMAGALGTTMPSPMQQATQLQYPQDTQAFMNTGIPTGRGTDPPGMIPVPDDMRKILAAQQAAGRPYAVPGQGFQNNPAILRQQQIAQQQQMQQNRWANNAPYFGKLMVGSLAGLMIVEAVRESEQSNENPEGRGLFGVPAQLIMSFVNSTHFTLGGYHISTAQFFLTLKVLVLFGALLWVFVPSLFTPRPPKSQKASLARSLEAVPSLASPIHVRRQAWLTAIQTVWVPRHNFILEAAALILKTLKLSLRNTIGTSGYQMLTGLTEEQEIARVKAWMIALDAQLAGGDVEVNKSRLMLTLLASGTLPDTPQRLMLKALHIRVLLWQSDFVPKAVNVFAAHLARRFWNEAKQLDRLLVQLRKGSNPPADDEPLPDHLAVLLEQDSDDVLNDDIIQRAHNLAWNRPTMYNVVEHIDGMNAVVEDPAVRSPMDAVCAWYSSLTLQHVLAASLGDRKKAGSGPELELAIKLAPIGSNAQIRALVARTFVADEKRGANIAAAMQAMAPAENPDKHPQYASGVPPLIDSPTIQPISIDPDVHTALRCSQAMAHLQKYASPPRWALDIINSIVLSRTREGLTCMSLLGFTAAFHLMDCLDQHEVGREACAVTLERLAATLRVWVGGVEGDVGALGEEQRCQLVERCLDITKSVVGMEPDPGYGSMSDCDETEGGC